MASEILDFVMAQPLFDAHEHLAPPAKFGPQMLTPADMAGYATGDLAAARGPASAKNKPRQEDQDPVRYFFETWEKTRNTGYCRASERACKDLFGLDFTHANWPAIQEQIEETVAPDPRKWYDDTLRHRTGLKWVLVDGWHNVDEVEAGEFPDYFRFSYSHKSVVCIRGREYVFHNEKFADRSCHTLDEFLDTFMEQISECLATGKFTSLKIGSAYFRKLDYGTPTHREAEQAFDRLMTGKMAEELDDAGNPTGVFARELRPLQDHVVNRYVARATDEGMPVLIHTGYLAGNMSDLRLMSPLPLTTLFLRFRNTRFDLFHAGWPYHDLMAALGKHYPNVWLNFCWAWTMCPKAMEDALDMWLDAVPYCKIFGFGGDHSTPFNAYGYAMQARECIARVLERRIERGDMDLDLAKRVARAIMLENSETFHGLAETIP